MLKNHDRATIAQLGQPRSVLHLTHVMRSDPKTVTRDEKEVHKHLLDLEKRGLVVNLGEHDHPSNAVTNMPSQAFPYAEESKEIFIRRLSSPNHLWRLDGDLWILSKDGLDALHAPVLIDGVEPAPLTRSELQGVVNEMWSRTLKGVTAETYPNDPNHPDAVSLVNVFLEDEFLNWFGLVNEDCKQRWGKGVIAPLAGGAGKTDAYENATLDQENQKTQMPALVAPWFNRLSIIAFGDTDTATTSQDGSHKPGYTGYADKSVAAADMAAASAGSSSNANAITFAACTAGSATINGAGNNETNTTTGTFRKYGTVAGVAVSTTQTPPTFNVGAYVTTED